MSVGDEERSEFSKSEEFKSFLVLTVVMAPLLTGVIVVAYGFVVWIYQLLAGPPTGG